MTRKFVAYFSTLPSPFWTNNFPAPVSSSALPAACTREVSFYKIALHSARQFLMHLQSSCFVRLPNSSPSRKAPPRLAREPNAQSPSWKVPNLLLCSQSRHPYLHALLPELMCSSKRSYCNNTRIRLWVLQAQQQFCVLFPYCQCHALLSYPTTIC